MVESHVGISVDLTYKRNRYEGSVFRETQKAYLIEFSDNSCVWIPKQLLQFTPGITDNHGDRIEGSLPDWFTMRREQ